MCKDLRLRYYLLSPNISVDTYVGLELLVIFMNFGIKSGMVKSVFPRLPSSISISLLRNGYVELMSNVISESTTALV